MTLKELITRIQPLDEAAMEAARRRQDALAKPPRSLGRLEDLSIQLAGITGKVQNTMDKTHLLVFAADNGVVEEGVSSAPQSVTLMQTVNLTRAKTGASVLCKHFGAGITVCDVGVNAIIREPAVLDRKIAFGTQNIAKGPAMTREQAEKAILIGAQLAMDTPAEVLEDAVTYMQIYFGGVLFSVVYNMAAGILNAAGNSQRSLLYLGIASGTNILLDLVLIAGLRMGVAGAAIATDISQLVSCALALRFLMRVQDDYRVTAREIRVHGKMAVRIIKVGLPTGIQNMVISLSNILVQAGVNGYGAAAMAGFAAYMKVDGFNILPIMSFSMAATTFVGQNFGAGKLDRVKKSLWVTLGMGVVYTILTGVLLLAFQDPIMHLFTHEEDVVAFGCTAMHYFCPFYWELSILHGLAGTVRGTGKTIPPMVVLLVSLCVFRIGWIQWVLPFFSSIDGIFLLYPVSWGLGALMMVGYAWKANWLET